jgi:uncharacterized protein (DUF1015 family)
MHQHSVAEAVAALGGMEGEVAGVGGIGSGVGVGAAPGGAQAAFLLRPVTAGQIEAWAVERKQMPPKTTYFSPKPRTGMVFRSLDL